MWCACDNISDTLNDIDNEHVIEWIIYVMSEWVNGWDSEIRNKVNEYGSVCMWCVCNTHNVFIW